MGKGGPEKNFGFKEAALVTAGVTAGIVTAVNAEAFQRTVDTPPAPGASLNVQPSAPSAFPLVDIPGATPTDALVNLRGKLDKDDGIFNSL